jgi:hypothetical protein
MATVTNGDGNKVTQDQSSGPNLLEILQLRLKMAMTILHGKTGWK